MDDQEQKQKQKQPPHRIPKKDRRQVERRKAKAKIAVLTQEVENRFDRTFRVFYDQNSIKITLFNLDLPRDEEANTFIREFLGRELPENTWMEYESQAKTTTYPAIRIWTYFLP